MQGRTKRTKIYTLNVIVIGDSGVGKSSIIERYVDDIFTDRLRATIGVDYRIRNHSINSLYNYSNEDVDRIAKVQVWDTGGQERFRTISESYYKNAQAVILVCDLSDRGSLTNLQHWYDEAMEKTPNNPFIMVVGNKSDLESTKVVSDDDLRDFAERNNCTWDVVSAKTGTNVENVFSKIVKEVATPQLKQEAIKATEESKKDNKWKRSRKYHNEWQDCNRIWHDKRYKTDESRILALLSYYTKNDSIFAHFLFWGRKNLDEVKSILVLSKGKKLKDANSLLQEIKNINLKNARGTLATIINFIDSELPSTSTNSYRMLDY